MKKKILKISLITLIFICAMLIFTNKANAYEYYNSEISYSDNYDGTVTVVAAGTSIESATIPSYINGKKVTEIDGFENCKYMTSVTIPNTVEIISYSTFRNCSSLKSVTIPNSVKKIYADAFYGCSSLESITIPSSVSIIEDGAFENCTKLKKVVINNGPTLIGYSAFEGCTSLTDVSIPNSVKTISTGVFKGCTSLVNITIPSSVENMYGSYAEGIFENCTSLKTVTINAKITNISERMFYNCTALTTVNFTDKSKKTMDSSVFENCTALTTITLPEGLTVIGYEAFKNCKSLKTVNISDTVETISNNAFQDCTALTSMNIPCGVRTIEGDGSEDWSYNSGAFKGCTSLKTLYFTKTIQKIGSAAFIGVNKSQLTFYGYSGSAAKTFANEKNIKYVECTPVTSIKVSGSTSVLKKSFITLKANITPSNAFNKNVKWISSNENIATVSNTGVVTGKGVGSATITATAKDGTAVKATYTVKVVNTEMPFRDVTVDDWYYNAVKYVYQHKTMSGTTSTTFAPNQKLTRGMIVTMLYNMENHPSVKGTSKFSDVQNKNVYFYNAVVWASNNKVVSGYANGKFGPDDNITREQLATILYNYCRYKGKYKTANANYSKFTDSNKISSFAKWGMNWAVGNKIVNGSNGKLNPQGTATRAEAAAMISNYCNTIK